MAFFLINPRKRKAARKTAKRSRSIPKTERRRLRKKARAAGEKWFGVNPGGIARRRKVAQHTRSTRGGPMAKRRRRKGTMPAGLKRYWAAKRGKAAANPRKRRRRAAAPRVRHALLLNPRRRRRRSVLATHRRRRHGMRRNPPIIALLKQGAMDGTAVYAGGLIARKVNGAIVGMLPASASLPGGAVIPQVGAAVIISMFGQKFAPKYARMLAAGAFSQAIASVVALTPLAPYLSGFGAIGPRRFVRAGTTGRHNLNGVGAWPNTGQPRGLPGRGEAGLGAWPRVGMPQVVGN